METVAILGIDLGKNSCSVVGLDGGGKVVLRRRLSREGVVKLASGLPKCVTAMEAAELTTSAACCSSWATKWRGPSSTDRALQRCQRDTNGTGTGGKVGVTRTDDNASGPFLSST